jgi:hypothetical protein
MSSMKQTDFETAHDDTRRDGGFAHLAVLAAASVFATLGVLAVAGADLYSTHSKTAEATRCLGAIETGEKNGYQQETDLSGNGVGPYVHKFCPSAAPVPTKIPAGTRAGTPMDFDTEGWRCLKFSINEPHRYQYGVVGNPKIGTDARYVATARGDLDGDGVSSKFELEGRGGASGDAERVRVEITDEDE